MTELLMAILDSILHGGVAAIFTLLVCFIAYLIYDRYQTSKEYSALRESHEKTILDVIDKYHQGQLTLVQTLNELKTILIVIKERG